MYTWWKLSTNIAMAGFEAQRVIALRLARLAAGGPNAAREARLMISEKLVANGKAAITLASGGSAHSVVSRYRAIMHANEKRLAKRKR
jgi:hypothetical protein